MLEFYFKRAKAYSDLSRYKEAIGDAELALGYATPPSGFTRQIRQFIALEYQEMGNYPKAIDALLEVERRENKGGWLFNMQRNVAQNYFNMGNPAEAEVYLGKNLALIEAVQSGSVVFGCQPDICAKEPLSGTYSLNGEFWEADVSVSRALAFVRQGKYRDAELAYLDAERLERSGMRHRQLTNAKYSHPRSRQLLVKSRANEGEAGSPR